MKWRLYHPLWTHLPAVILLAAMAIEFLRNRWIFQYAVPVHFNFYGKIDRWGSGWEILLPVAIIAVILFAISLLIDELWARQERRKTFNWMSLFDETALGIFAGMIFSYFRQAYPGDAPGGYAGFNQMPDWPWILGVTVAAVLFACLLEYMRPYRPVPVNLPKVDTRALESEIHGRALAGQRWVYWESQNPRWMSPLVFAISAVLLAIGIITWRVSLWISLPYLIMTPLLFLIYGGLRVSVNKQRLEVRLGILGLHLLNLPISDIEEADVHEFSPLRDFGGYGIRFNRQMKAYFFRGNRGVKVRTVQGKQYLIGSDTPEQLAVVIQAIREHRPEDEGGA